MGFGLTCAPGKTIWGLEGTTSSVCLDLFKDHKEAQDLSRHFPGEEVSRKTPSAGGCRTAVSLGIQILTLLPELLCGHPPRQWLSEHRHSASPCVGLSRGPLPGQLICSG